MNDDAAETPLSAYVQSGTNIHKTGTDDDIPGVNKIVI